MLCYSFIRAHQFTNSEPNAESHTARRPLCLRFSAADAFLLQFIYAVLLLPKAYGCKGCLWPVASATVPLIGGRPRRVEWGLITRRVRCLGTCSAGFLAARKWKPRLAAGRRRSPRS